MGGDRRPHRRHSAGQRVPRSTRSSYVRSILTGCCRRMSGLDDVSMPGRHTSRGSHSCRRGPGVVVDARPDATHPDTLLAWDDARPITAEETWQHYRHDSGLSVAWALREAPRQAVPAHVLAPLLAPGPFPRRVRHLAVRALPRRPGRRPRRSPSHRRTHPPRLDHPHRPRRNPTRPRADRAHQAAREEAEGGGVGRLTCYLTTTVTDDTLLDAATATTSNNAPDKPNSASAASAARTPPGSPQLSGSASTPPTSSDPTDDHDGPAHDCRRSPAPEAVGWPLPHGGRVPGAERGPAAAAGAPPRGLGRPGAARARAGRRLRRAGGHRGALPGGRRGRARAGPPRRRLRRCRAHRDGGRRCGDPRRDRRPDRRPDGRALCLPRGLRRAWQRRPDARLRGTDRRRRQAPAPRGRSDAAVGARRAGHGDDRRPGHAAVLLGGPGHDGARRRAARPGAHLPLRRGGLARRRTTSWGACMWATATTTGRWRRTNGPRCWCAPSTTGC